MPGAAGKAGAARKWRRRVGRRARRRGSGAWACRQLVPGKRNRAGDAREVLGFSWQVAAFKARQPVFLEENGHATACYFTIAALEPEQVIPTVGMEHVGKKRRAQHEAHLFLRHAFF
jgi:hypothetical protein